MFACDSDIQRVLREDREKLRQMQKSQPRFSEEQKKELAEVHPWLRRGGLPKAIDVKVSIHARNKRFILKVHRSTFKDNSMDTIQHGSKT